MKDIDEWEDERLRKWCEMKVEWNINKDTSHNWSLTVLSSKYIVFDKKSIPIVAYRKTLRRYFKNNVLHSTSLHLYYLLFYKHHKGGRVRVVINTWYVLSKVSYMNLVIIEVLPTDWSPRKTSLYLERASILCWSPLGGAGVDVGVVVVAMWYS